MAVRMLGRDRIWNALYRNVVAVLEKYGTESAVGRGDFWVIEDDHGLKRIGVDVFNFKLFSVSVIEELRGLLANIQDWEIVLIVDMPKSGEEWPFMGVMIRWHEIVDGLQREYLPEGDRPPEIPGSRPGLGYD